jgi:hypothetical protein
VVASIAETPPSGTVNAFESALASEGLAIRDVAYTLQIEKQNLEDVKDVGQAKVTMAVGPDWVMRNGGPGQVRIVRYADDLTSQALPTTYKGVDIEGSMVFEAESPNGLSIFALIAVKSSQEVITAETPLKTAAVTGEDLITAVPGQISRFEHVLSLPRFAPLDILSGIKNRTMFFPARPV